MENNNLARSSRFSDYLSLPQVVYDLKSKDKVEAVEELLDVLAKQTCPRASRNTPSPRIDGQEATDNGKGAKANG